MDRYKENAKWLMYLAPFRGTTLSTAYFTPFFFMNGLNLEKVFLLQTIFSVVVLLWELPSGYIADRFGRAFSIKVSAPIAALSIGAYGFSHEFWQFVVCEIVMAISYGLISGIDTALLFDSLKADGREKEYVKISQRMNSIGYIATAVGVPIAVLLVHFVSISSTLVADGLLTGFGAIFVLRLVEAPRSNGSQEAIRLSAWHSTKQLVRNAEARWLVLLGATLSVATYLTFWLSAPYYSKMGIPVVWFGFILAVRSLWKAWLSHKFTQEKHLQRNMIAYAGLAGLVYVTMATGQLWLVWAVLGHDMVQALSSQPITAKLNAHIEHEFRATMNSLVNLVQRLITSVVGPLLGLLVDRTNLGTGFLVTGVAVSVIAFLALARLHRLKTFSERR